VRVGELERVLDDPVNTLVGVQLFLDRHLVFGPGFEAAADAHVEPLGVLAKDDEVHGGGRLPFQRAEPLVEQLHRPVVDVEIELEARAEQDVARMAVVGHARIAERADEDRVELVAQHRIAVRRHRDAGLQVVLGAPRQHLEIEARAEHFFDCSQHFHRFRGRFHADSIAGDHSYTH
jgi:hypothetical protein